MANSLHVDQLRLGITAWNQWRLDHPHEVPDLTGLDVGGVLAATNPRPGPRLKGTRYNLSGIDLRGARLWRANLEFVDLVEAHLEDAELTRASMRRTNLHGANLSRAFMYEVDLYQANLAHAILHDVNLVRARIVDTSLDSAELVNCEVYGVSAWNVSLAGATQVNLRIADPSMNDPSPLTVDSLLVAQFLHLLINNANIRDVINTLTTRVVLILGRFTPERKRVLDAVRAALQAGDQGYVPVVFDFEQPSTRNLTETVTLLARMARFIIADLTDPSSVPHEAMAVVQSVKVPFVPIIAEGYAPYAMFRDLAEEQWVLDPFHYAGVGDLVDALQELITRADDVVEQIARRRREVEERWRSSRDPSG